MSWIAILAYIYALVYGIKYLSSRNLDHDIHSSSAAALGTVFCILATATGSIWAKFNWGSFWNWDPRQTSIFVLLLIYAAYFALRSSIENEHQRAKLSSAYSIIGGVSAIFFVYIAPRLYEGLHPGAAGDKSIGPVLSPQAHSLNHLKQIILSLSFAGFTILFFWLLGLTVRIRRLALSSPASTEE
jgi:heme exporter protein C